MSAGEAAQLPKKLNVIIPNVSGWRVSTGDVNRVGDRSIVQSFSAISPDGSEHIVHLFATESWPTHHWVHQQPFASGKMTGDIVIDEDNELVALENGPHYLPVAVAFVLRALGYWVADAFIVEGGE